jgi:hypothetical protein
METEFAWLAAATLISGGLAVIHADWRARRTPAPVHATAARGAVRGQPCHNLADDTI